MSGARRSRQAGRSRSMWARRPFGECPRRAGWNSPNSTRQPHPVHRATHPRREPQRNLTDRRTTAIREPHANLLVRCINQSRTNLDRVAPLTMPPGLLAHEPTRRGRAAGGVEPRARRAGGARLRQGRGRTGTSLACLAVLDGVPVAEAVTYVRARYGPSGGRDAVAAPLHRPLRGVVGPSRTVRRARRHRPAGPGRSAGCGSAPARQPPGARRRPPRRARRGRARPRRG